MRSFFLVLKAVLLFVACAAPAAQANDPDPPIRVMVIGSWHMAGSDRNVIDAPGPDMLTDRRQAEFRALASRLLEFRPTLVAVEEQVLRADRVDDRFAGFGPEMLAANASEEV